MTINSKQKGNRFERDLAAKFREYGYDARRGQQFQGGADSPDVVGLPRIHVEAKHVEKLNVREAYAQAKRDSAEDRFPAVFWKRNNMNTLVIIDIDDFMAIFTEYDASMELAGK